MTDDNDLQILRQRYAGFWDAADRLFSPNPTTTARMLCRTVSGGSYPTSTGRYYLANPVSLTGSESEGGSATLTADTSLTIPVLVVRGVPPVGTNLLARSIGGRWVSEYKSAVSGCTTGTLVFTVTGCGVNQSGATVTVTGPGGFSASGTTDSLGQVTFSIVGYPSGSYSWTVSKSPRFVTQSGTKSVLCSSVNTQLVILGASTGYRCATCCGIPIKENLWLTTPFGQTVAFNFVTSQWQATVVENIACRKGSGCATSSTEACSFFYSMLGTGCSPSGNSAVVGVGSGGYDITTSPPTMVCDDRQTCTINPVVIGPSGSTTRTCSPFSVTYSARFTYNPFTGVDNTYGTVTVTE